MAEARKTDESPEALARLAASARQENHRPGDVGNDTTAETAGRPDDLGAMQQEATEMLQGGAKRDAAQVDAAIDRRKTEDKRSP